jgi:hypothetical protein
MNTQQQETLRAAEQSVRQLVEECRKNGTLYPRNPKKVAQVSRTGKWLLNAIASLNRALAKVDPIVKTRKVLTLATIQENSALPRRFLGPLPSKAFFFPSPHTLHQG